MPAVRLASARKSSARRRRPAGMAADGSGRWGSYRPPLADRPPCRRHQSVNVLAGALLGDRHQQFVGGQSVAGVDPTGATVCYDLVQIVVEPDRELTDERSGGRESETVV